MQIITLIIGNNMCSSPNTEPNTANKIMFSSVSCACVVCYSKTLRSKRGNAYAIHCSKLNFG